MIGQLVLAYAAWLVAIGLASWLLMSWYALAMHWYMLAGWSVWGVAFFQNVVFIVLILSWLAWVIASEHWLRTAAGRGRLRRALTLALGPLALAAVASYGILQIT